MKRNGKKIISLFLVFVLLFSMSYSAFAAAAETITRVSVTLSSDKKQYKSGEEIKLQTKIKNSTGNKQYVSVVYRATPFAKFDDAEKYSIKYAEIENDANKEFSATAKARHSTFDSEWIQGIYDAVFGSFWSSVYMIIAMFNSRYEPVSIKVDGVPTVVMVEVTSSMTLPGEEEKYKVSFDANYDGAEKIKTQMVRAGECAIEPTVEREGYNLIGWYIAPTGFVDFFDFSSVIDRDITVYARWVKIDDTKDSDNDGIIDSIEMQFGSDPNNSDSDNDGISDYDELNWLNTNPNDPNDGNGDADNDGLTNAEESALGTNPAYYDSDYDSVSDYDEIYKYKTNPLVADTDGDGVNDGLEIQNGSDPLKAEKAFETKKDYGTIDENNRVSVSAKVVTNNDGAGTLNIREVSSTENFLVSDSMPGYLGAAYDFSAEGQFISGQISFTYDKSLGKIGENFQPRIYYINETTGEFEELKDQTIEDGLITATVEHFSTYILLNKIEFDKVWDADIKKPNEEGTGMKNLLISFVIDSSGSMSWNDPNGLRKDLTKGFIEKMADTDQASIIDFDLSVKTNADFTNDKNALRNAVDMIDSYGGTNMYAGLSQALTLFKNLNATDDDSLKTAFLLSDGSDDGASHSESQYMALVDECVLNGIQVYTIGLGNEANTSLLEKIAKKGNGKYYFAEKDLDLIEGFDELRKETIDYITDSNNDGICDYYTNLINSGKLLPANGSYSFVGVIDMYGENNNDWDGDGLLNGEEIEISTSSSGNVYVKINSNPLDSDSDGDGIDDYTEVKKNKTNPLKYTKYGGSELNQFVSDDGYVYVEQVNQKTVSDSIIGVFDWQKTDETKETYINYFYDYASEKCIKEAEQMRTQQLKREEAWKFVEAVASWVKFGKDVLDLGTDLGSKDSVVKAQVTKYNNLHKRAVSLYNKKQYDEVIKEVGISDFNNDLKVANDINDFLSKTEVAEKAEAVASGALHLAKIIPALKKVKLPLNEKFDTFSKKYQIWLGKRPTGDISVGTVISVAADTIDLVTDIADLANVYGKLQANSEAFEEYTDLIQYIAQNAKNDYTRVAAGDVIKIVLAKTDEEYYKQLNVAVAKTSAKAFIDIGLTIAGDVCPYVKVAKLVLDIAKIAISLTGITACAKALVKSQAIYAISLGCKHLIKGKYSIEDEWYSFDYNDGDRIVLYLTQLAQSRIVGEFNICNYLTSWSLSHMFSYLITHSSKKDIIDNFRIITKYLYSCAYTLGLKLSPNLPVCQNGEWVRYEDAKKDSNGQLIK